MMTPEEFNEKALDAQKRVQVLFDELRAGGIQVLIGNGRLLVNPCETLSNGSWPIKILE